MIAEAEDNLRLKPSADQLKTLKLTLNCRNTCWKTVGFSRRGQQAKPPLILRSNISQNACEIIDTYSQNFALMSLFGKTVLDLSEREEMAAIKFET